MHFTRFVCWFALLVGTLAPFSVDASDVDFLNALEAAGASVTVGDVAGVAGVALTAGEMDETTGALHVRGIRVRNRARRARRRSFRTSNRNAVHCDIIARNRAEALGLDTDAGPGAGMDFNRMTVSQIYQGYGGRGSSTPRAGTAGYVFTSYGGSKSHLQVYDARGTGGNQYRRYMNGSRPNSESNVLARNSYRPSNVTGQVFVAIPRRGYQTTWYR